MFKSITIRNLRAITELTIGNLGQVNLFVGQNNCGKTTILEALFFLIGATNPKLPVSANVFRGLTFLSNTLWHTYFHNMVSTIPIEIVGQTRDTMEKQKLLIYPRSKKTSATQPLVADSVSFAGDSKPLIELDGLKLHYTSSQEPNAETISTVFIKDKELISEGSKERPVRGIFVSYATEFDWKARFDAVQDKKRIPDVISAMTKIEPRISDLRLNAIGLLVADIGLPNLIPVNLIGGGTARFLSIALAILDSRKGIVMIDEIDNGLHHSAQETIWKAVFAWAEELDVQVFATTHSYECIKAFTTCAKSSLFADQAKLFRIERKDDSFKSIDFGPEELAGFFEKMWEIG